jgi:hypothetical protein
MRRIAFLWLMAIAIAAPTAGEAEESGFPKLGDHIFVPVLALTEPFLVTYVQTNVGLGSTVNSSIPLLSPIDSTVIGTVESDQILTGLGFEYQQRVRDWLAVRLALDVAGRLGSDTNTLLSDGVTGALSYDFNWMMRIYRAKSVLVSGSIGLASRNATFVNLLDWAEDLVAGKDAKLVRPRTSLIGTGGVHAAWGVNHRFGLLGTLTASYGESFDGSGDNAWYSDVRAALSYDISQDLDVPLGLALTGGRSENDLNADTDSGTWFWSARLAVQGRSDFTIGLDLGTYYFDSATQSASTQFRMIVIDMRYYF